MCLVETIRARGEVRMTGGLSLYNVLEILRRRAI